MVKYAGVFASAARLRKKLRPAQPAEKPPSPPPAALPRDPMALLLPWATDTLRQRRLVWAALIKRVYAVDVLECGRCKGRMRVMAFVTDPDSSRAILEHLGLPTTGPPQAPARAARVRARVGPERPGAVQHAPLIAQTSPASLTAAEQGIALPANENRPFHTRATALSVGRSHHPGPTAQRRR